MAPFFRESAFFGLFLAVFCASGAADGEKWVFSPVWGNMIDGRAASVIYGGGQFVAVGKYGAISTSQDGRSWTARSSRGYFDLSSVAWGEEAGYVVLGDSGRITLTSADGVDWVERETNIAKRAYAVFYAGGKYFAGTSVESYPPLTYYSLDGVHWAVCNVIDGMVASGNLNAITYGNSVFMGVQHSNDMVVSIDGVNWDISRSFQAFYNWAQEPPYGSVPMPAPDNLHTVAYGNNIFLVGGPDNRFGWSEDGTEWTIPWAFVIPEHWQGNYYHIIHDGTRFVVIRDNDMLFTADGKELALMYSGFPKRLGAIASDGNASIVVLSNDGQMGLLTRDTTASSVTPKPSPPKSTPGLSFRQSGKTLTLTLPRSSSRGERLTVSLYSISGKKQKVSPVFSATGSSASLSVSHIPSGVYVLTVRVGKESWRSQVVVKR